MSKIDIGTIIALIIAVASGVFWLGKLDQRVASLEGNENSVKTDIFQGRNEAIRQINDEREKILKQINEKMSEISKMSISQENNKIFSQLDLKKKEVLDEIKS